MKIFIQLIAGFVLMVASGYVFVSIWEWLILPIFNLPELRLIEGIGIMMFLNFVKGYRQTETDFSDSILLLTIIFCLSFIISLFY